MEIKINAGLNYLIFQLTPESFAIDTSNVVEIMELPALTVVPNAPSCIKGILNFRGEIVAIIDMRKRFNMKPDDNPVKMVIIIKYKTGNDFINLGLLVDKVDHVIEFEMKDVLNVPDLGVHDTNAFFTGTVKLENEFAMLLDIEKALDLNELTK